MTDGNEPDLSNFSMLELFRTEVETQAAVLSEGLLALESDPGATEGIESLMRAAHSIKGAARIVGLDAAVQVSHRMEDCFVAAGEGKVSFKAEDIDVLLRGVDMVTRISQVGEAEAAAWLSGHQGEIEGLVGELAGILDPGAAPVAGKKRGEEPASTAQASPSEPPAASEDEGPDLSGFSMLELFRTEVETQAGVLSEGLLALEADPGATEGIESLMRAAHSIKGAARIVGLDAAVQVSHRMEDCFVAAGEGKVSFKAEDIDVLLRGVDMITRISQVGEAEAAAWLSGHQGEIEGLVGALSAVLSPGAAPAVGQKREEKPPPTVAQKPPPVQASPPLPAKASPPSSDGKDRAVRVTAENLNRLMGLAGESLVEARWLRPFSDALLKLKKGQAEVSDLLGKLRDSLEGFDLNEYAEEYLAEIQQKANESRQVLSDRINDFEVFARRSANLSNRLYREVIASRMRPFADGMQGFPRMVRDVSRKLGKKVRLEVVGKSTDVDRDILEKLEAPLNHILRNSVDHGIELPEERLAAGKPEEGTVRVEARHRAGMLSITVSDDGKGIDPERLRQKVLEKKLVSPEMGASLTEAELMEFMFLPGFSTAKQVTEISGRGVGLDVVQSMVQEVGGTVRAVSQPGKGMSFHLQLPLTLSVIRTLLVSISGEPYAFPLGRIDRSLMIPRGSIEAVEDRQFFTLDGEHIGLVTALQVLELKEEKASREELAVVVVSDRMNRYGLVVDRFLGERDLVVRPLDQRLGKVPDISAAAVMVDGAPVLIVDVEDMVRSIDNLLSGGRLRKVGRSAVSAGAQGRKRILVVDDSITVREVERKLLENNGYEVEVAVNGMDGWNAVRTGHYDMVISDVDMPRMNGIELVTHIKRDPALKSMPVVIVSYKDREEDRVRGLEAGANYYLTKSSFQDETLVRAVVDLIGEATS